jgi:hypothetical protein
MTAIEIIDRVIDWLQVRLRERTSWDGITIVTISIMTLVASPLIEYAGWVGLAYGIWTLWKTEKRFTF